MRNSVVFLLFNYWCLVKNSNFHVNGIDLNESSLTQKNEYFYIYELDEVYWWRWPKPNTECTEQGYLSHQHAVNSGLGPLILPESGLFLTWHFSLFSSLYNRLKRSKRRTMDRNKATLFVIPYDLGLDGYMDPYTCNNRRSCTRNMVPFLQNYLLNQSTFTRYSGKDHVVLWSLGQYHPWPHNACDIFMKDFCGHCAMTCYWMDATKPETRFVSVPFPSGYHWWDGITDIPWITKGDFKIIRNYTAVYIGSIQTLNPTHTKIRRAMTTQCSESKDCHWLQLGHSSIDNNIINFLTMYRRSIFCLIPPGDDPARKALFDAILSGCIPVIFEVATLYNQYPWHIGEQAALDISIYIPGHLIRANQLKFMNVLLNISDSIIVKKQQAIAKLAPMVQYSAPPIKLLENISDDTPWDPPFEDGVDVLLNGLFNRKNKLLNNQSTGLPPKLQSGREWGREYEQVKIVVPRLNETVNICKYFRVPTIECPVQSHNISSSAVVEQVIEDLDRPGVRVRNASQVDHIRHHKRKHHHNSHSDTVPLEGHYTEE